MINLLLLLLSLFQLLLLVVICFIFVRLKTLLRSDLSLKIKWKIIETMIYPIVRYGSELWPDTIKIRKEIDAFEHWALRRVLKISWTERVSNEEVRRKMGILGPILGTKIKERIFRSLGHVLRESAGN